MALADQGESKPLDGGESDGRQRRTTSPAVVVGFDGSATRSFGPAARPGASAVESSRCTSARIPRWRALLGPSVHPARTTWSSRPTTSVPSASPPRRRAVAETDFRCSLCMPKGPPLTSSSPLPRRCVRTCWSSGARKRRAITSRGRLGGRSPESVKRRSSSSSPDLASRAHGHRTVGRAADVSVRPKIFSTAI